MPDSAETSSPTKTPWWKGSRGEWYVIAQFLIGALIFFGPRTAPGWPMWPLPIDRIASLIGGLLLLAGTVLFLWGLAALGKNLTPLPHPKKESVMVEQGPYRFVRHPMYGGVLMLAVGYALIVHGWLTLLFAAALFLLLDLKSRREEQWLMEKFPDYTAYRQNVARFVPFLY